MASDYKDFRCYELMDTGEKNEVNIEINELKDHLHVENVLLLVRFDLRRLFIWKGPKSPVRKRFISSREGSKIQEEAAKGGAHLKIVSVDAGDEPSEFLDAFSLDRFEIKEEDRPEDMVYIRNEDRRKAEEAMQAEAAKKNAEPKEYWSPLMEEAKKAEKQKAKAAIVEDEDAPAPKPLPKVSVPPRMESFDPSSSADYARPEPVRSGPRGLSEADEKAILDMIVKEGVPSTQKRLNVIIGTHLFGPQEKTAKVFGKVVKSEEWGRITEVPEGKIDIDSGLLRIYVQKGEIQGIEVLKAGDEDAEFSSTPPQDSEEETESKPKPKGKKGKRELPEIPRGEDE